MGRPRDADRIGERLRGIRDARPINDSHARFNHWQACWAQHDHPPYFGKGAVSEFEQFKRLREELYDKYALRSMPVAEFGCGPGDNLVALMPCQFDAMNAGYDWSPEAVYRCKKRGLNAAVFDMFNPDWQVTIPGAALTIHAMEQLGAEFETFATFLLRSKPKLVVHVEPIVELYDEIDLDDFLCKCYHERRGYLTGYLPWLQSLENEVEILEVRKSTLGNLHHRAYSVIAWRPK